MRIATLAFALLIGLFTACGNLNESDPAADELDAAPDSRATDSAAWKAIEAQPDATTDGNDGANGSDGQRDGEAAPDATRPIVPDASDTSDATKRADVTTDAATDAATDAPPDAATDAPPDAAADAATDARPDAPPDAATDAPPDAATDAPPDAAPDPGTLWASPVLPAFGAATTAHVRAVRAQGMAMGLEAGRFAKVGDSITASPSFLVDVGLGKTNYGAYAALAPTVSAFAGALPDGSNSFSRTSLAAKGGWRAADPLGPPDAVAAELTELKPAYAIVMLGTNNVGTNMPLFHADLERVVDKVESLGTVPILSTVPDRRDYPAGPTDVTAVNDEIRSLAATKRVPLIDLYKALAPLAGAGLSSDQFHPSAKLGNTADFTSPGLSYGYDVRNLTVLQMLDRLRSL